MRGILVYCSMSQDGEPMRNNSQQHATTFNWVCKRTQRRNIQQFCVSLHGGGLSSPRIKTNNSLNRKSVINWGIGKLALLSAKSVLWTSELPLLSRVIQQHLGNCMWCFVYLLQSSTNSIDKCSTCLRSKPTGSLSARGRDNFSF